MHVTERHLPKSGRNTAIMRGDHRSTGGGRRGKCGRAHGCTAAFRTSLLDRNGLRPAHAPRFRIGSVNYSRLRRLAFAFSSRIEWRPIFLHVFRFSRIGLLWCGGERRFHAQAAVHVRHLRRRQMLVQIRINKSDLRARWRSDFETLEWLTSDRMYARSDLCLAAVFLGPF